MKGIIYMLPKNSVRIKFRERFKLNIPSHRDLKKLACKDDMHYALKMLKKLMFSECKIGLISIKVKHASEVL